MRQVLCICYVIFIVVVTTGSAMNDFRGTDYPMWMSISGIAAPGLGIVAMLLYAFSFRPRIVGWIWKIVPVLIVLYYAVEWYFDFVVYRKPDMSPPLLGIVTIVGLLMLFPLFYSTFMLGYSSEFEE